MKRRRNSKKIPKQKSPSKGHFLFSSRMSENLDASFWGVPSPAVKETPAVNNEPAANVESHSENSVQQKGEPKEEPQEAKLTAEPLVVTPVQEDIKESSEVPEQDKAHKSKVDGNVPAQISTDSQEVAVAAKALAEEPPQQAGNASNTIAVTVNKAAEEPPQADPVPEKLPERNQSTEENKATPQRSESVSESEKKPKAMEVAGKPQGAQIPQGKKVANPTKRVIMRLSLRKPPAPKQEEAWEAGKANEPPKERTPEEPSAGPVQADVKPPAEEVPSKPSETPNEKTNDSEPVPQKDEEVIEQVSKKEVDDDNSAMPLKEEPTQESAVIPETGKENEGTETKEFAPPSLNDLSEDTKKIEEMNRALIQEGIAHLIESMNEKLSQEISSSQKLLREGKMGSSSSSSIRTDTSDLSGISNGGSTQVILTPNNSSIEIEEPNDLSVHLVEVPRYEMKTISGKKFASDGLVRVLPRNPSETAVSKVSKRSHSAQDKKDGKSTNRILLRFTLRKSSTPKSESPNSEASSTEQTFEKLVEKTKSPEKAPKAEAEKVSGKTPKKALSKASRKALEKKPEKSPMKKPEKTPVKARPSQAEKKTGKSSAKTPEKAPDKTSTKTSEKKSVKDDQKTSKTPQKPIPVPRLKKKRVQESLVSDSETETETDTDCECALGNTGVLRCLPPSKRIKIDPFKVDNKNTERRYLTAALKNLNTRAEIIATLIENANLEWSEVRKSKTKQSENKI